MTSLTVPTAAARGCPSAASVLIEALRWQRALPPSAILEDFTIWRVGPKKNAEARYRWSCVAKIVRRGDDERSNPDDEALNFRNMSMLIDATMRFIMEDEDAPVAYLEV